MKRIALINDLSGVGRCSLTVALPVLSAMGHECAALPTAVLSNHTGFEKFTFYDFTDKMPEYIDCWESLDLHFDAIYSGFLGSARQIDITLDFIKRFGKDAIKTVDPVMGDNGSVYATCDSELQRHMLRLVAAADVITPNLTELCVLSGRDYPEKGAKLCDVKDMCAALQSGGVRDIVVTGLTPELFPELESGVANLVCSGGGYTLIGESRVPVNYCGTGDLFASVLCGALTSGMSLIAAVRRAASFTSLCVKDTQRRGGGVLYGVMFEDKLKYLWE